MGNFSLTQHRIRSLIFVLAVFFVLFCVRLVQVQAIQAGEYRNRAVNEMENTKVLQAPRGSITDVNGIAFARSVAAISIVVDQTQISDPVKTSNVIAPILALTPAEVRSKITGTRKWNLVIKNGQPLLWQKLNVALQQYNLSLIHI